MSDLPLIAGASISPAAAWLKARHRNLDTGASLGVEVPLCFTSPEQELTALLRSAAVHDLGFRSFLQVTGEDRLRWLNGMVSNTVSGLAEGHLNYSLLLNAQGRIQGDATILRFPDMLILETDSIQLSRLQAHLDHFIIMDDVELKAPDPEITAIGLTGPESAGVLQRAGLPVPEPMTFLRASLAQRAVTVVHGHSPLIPRFELWVDTAGLASVWQALSVAGATEAGRIALEQLRVLEGTPQYGVDFSEKHLPQEINQPRALNFNKGCYLGQEIVERIRSRATVHRGLRQFQLQGDAPALESGQKLKLQADGADVGELSSIAILNVQGVPRTLALGFIRNEALERKLPLEYPGGTAHALESPLTLSGI